MRQSERPQPALGAAIRQLRIKRDLTQEALAADASLTVRTLSAIETGNANPTWATVRDIAAALGVSIGELAKLSEGHE
jgi:transcriptional regulator with XRE-family HTH domain